MTSSSNIIKLRAPIKKITILSDSPEDGMLISELEKAQASGKDINMVSMPQEEFDKEVQFAYQKGLEEGKLEGYHHAEEDYGQKLQALALVLESFEKEKSDFFVSAEKTLLEISINIVRKLVHELPQQIPGQIQKAINTVLGILSSEPVVEVFINPADLQDYKDLQTQFENRLPGLDKFSIKPDEKIQRGGCIVNTDTGKIDASVKTQAEKLVNEMHKTLTELSSEEEE